MPSVDLDAADDDVMGDRDARVLLVGVAGLAIGFAFALRVMLPHGMDPTVLIRLGDESPVQTTYARELLGDAVSRRDFAHDGRWFFIQANDPWYVEPERHAAVLDRPIYRAQRMLFPTIASGFGFFPPGVVLWSLIVTNIVALGLGALLGARLAVTHGLSPWLGLAIPLNPGLLFELEIGGAGILAYACCVAGVYVLAKGRRNAAALSFAAAALSKEVTLLFAGGVFVLKWLEERRPTWRLVVIPLVGVSLWLAYIWLRLVDVPGAGGAQRNFALPFTGIVDGFRIWMLDPIHLIVNVAIVAIVVAFVPVALRSRLPLAWGAVPFVGLAMILSLNVWRETHDFTRFLAPVFTAIPFLVAMSGRDRLVPSAQRAESIDSAVRGGKTTRGTT